MPCPPPPRASAPINYNDTQIKRLQCTITGNKVTAGTYSPAPHLCHHHRQAGYLRFCIEAPAQPQECRRDCRICRVRHRTSTRTHAANYGCHPQNDRPIERRNARKNIMARYQTAKTITMYYVCLFAILLALARQS